MVKKRPSDPMTDIEDKILELLRKNKEQGKDDLYTTEIAKQLAIASSTATKYLAILEAKGKVICKEKKPYKYWKIKD